MPRRKSAAKRATPSGREGRSSRFWEFSYPTGKALGSGAAELAKLLVDEGAELGVEVPAAHREDLQAPADPVARARVHPHEDAGVGGEVLAHARVELRLAAGHDDEALLGTGHRRQPNPGAP